MPIRRRLLIAASLATIAGGAFATAPAASVASTSCRTLSVGSLPLAKLETSYRTLTRLPPGTALVQSGPRRYGVCGSTHYAFDLLNVARGVHLTYQEQVAQQDHSPIWSKRAHDKWEDEGIDDLCHLAPHALINAWHVGTTCH